MYHIILATSMITRTLFFKFLVLVLVFTFSDALRLEILIKIKGVICHGLFCQCVFADPLFKKVSNG